MANQLTKSWKYQGIFGGTLDNQTQTDETRLQSKKLSARTAVTVFLAIAAGTVLAAVILPDWLPGLTNSLFNPEPKAFWYLSRSTAIVAYGLLWVSMTLGISISNKMALLWPGGPAAIDLHQFTSLLGLAFAVFHGLVLIGDSYLNIRLIQVFIPFSIQSYKPLWVGIGQISLYLWLIVTASFYIRRVIGHRMWRTIHYFSYGLMLASLLHAITSGTDAASPLLSGFYWSTGGILLALTAYRILLAVTNPRKHRQRQTDS